MELMLPQVSSVFNGWFDGGVDGSLPIVAMIILQMHRMLHPKHHKRMERNAIFVLGILNNQAGFFTKKLAGSLMTTLQSKTFMEIFMRFFSAFTADWRNFKIGHHVFGP